MNLTELEAADSGGDLCVCCVCACVCVCVCVRVCVCLSSCPSLSVVFDRRVLAAESVSIKALQIESGLAVRTKNQRLH